MEAFIKRHIQELHGLLKTMCLIPSPSHFEGEKANFVRNWLVENGAKGVYIDSAGNVVFPYGCEGNGDLVVFAAHTDTVFPMETPLAFTQDEENFFCPGVGDDTACVAVLLLAVKYLLQNRIRPKQGLLFVFNACEEGLGNLKGTRQLFADYAGRITRFYTYDGRYSRIADRCVGSYRYRVTVKTEGGHSWNSFGNRNAIAVLAQLVQRIYAMTVPEKEGSRTTFNVGTIEGGTSVNTIAQNASMLFEYRSDDPWCIGRMTEQWESILAAVRRELPDAEISVETVGIRPCGQPRDAETQEEMARRVIRICEEASGIPCKRGASSTDCNIPLSLGIPAVCCGVYLGGGAHTREEWVNIQSLETGLKIGIRIVLDYCDI